MTARLLFITHPEVVIDPAIDIRRWRLSDAGRSRMQTFAAAPVTQGITQIWTSSETKAVEAAGILAERCDVDVNIDADLGENDRSATGFLPPAEFELMADAFFAQPETSVRGWERAVDAQKRVRAALDRILARSTDGDIAIVAHGAVGTLLLCDLLGQPISRALDQPFQGHYWVASLPDRSVLHCWRPISERIAK